MATPRKYRSRRLPRLLTSTEPFKMDPAKSVTPSARDTADLPTTLIPEGMVKSAPSVIDLKTHSRRTVLSKHRVVFRSVQVVNRCKNASSMISIALPVARKPRPAQEPTRTPRPSAGMELFILSRLVATLPACVMTDTTPGTSWGKEICPAPASTSQLR